MAGLENPRVTPGSATRRGFVRVPRAPRPSARAITGAVRAFAEAARKPVRPDDPDARDPSFIGRITPLMDALYDGYFRCETEIEEPLPRGAYLAVANHNGMTGTPDMFCHMAAFWRTEGIERPAYGLMHDMPFHLPGAGALLNASGALRAHPRNAERALAMGAAVLVFPGGDVDACKPYRDRYEIRFGNRRGFIRVALQHGVPVVPVVSAGAHESLFIVTDGRRFAERSGLKKLFRTNVAPFGFALPFGVITGIAWPHVPPPVKIHTRILKPITFDAPPSAARDPRVVEACFERVVMRMRAAMSELRTLGRHGLFPRAEPREPLSQSQDSA